METRTPALELLERIQKQAISLGAGDPGLGFVSDTEYGNEFAVAFGARIAKSHPESSSVECENQAVALTRYLRELRESLPTQYEDPRAFSILQHRAAQVEAAITSMSLDLPVRPLLGTALARDVNARVFPVFGSDGQLNECLIVFNRIVVPFVYEMSGLLARVIPHGAQSLDFDGNAETPLDDALVTVFAECVSFVLLGVEMGLGTDGLADYVVVDGGKMPHVETDSAQQALRYVLTSGIELFLVAHEYAHLGDGHLTRPPSYDSSWNVKYKDTIARYCNEFDADYLGMRLMARAMETERIPSRFGNWMAFRFVGADIFLRCLDVLERAHAYALSGKEPYRGVPDPYTGDGFDCVSSSHPPAYLRSERLRQNFRRELSQECSDQTMQQIWHVYTSIEAVFEKFWYASKDEIARRCWHLAKLPELRKELERASSHIRET
jgi:hypothetical protein